MNTRKRASLNRLLTVFCAAALAGLFALPANAVVNPTYHLRPVSNDYMSATDYANARTYIMAQGRWNEVNSNANWYLTGDTIYNLPDGTLFFYFRPVKDFYPPDPVIADYAAANPILTNYYYPYSNQLSMVVTSVLGAVSAPWQLTGWPAAFTNATAYRTSFTGSLDLAYIPTGTYAAAFSRTRGYYAPPATSIVVSASRVEVSANWYRPYSNDLAVTISGVTIPTNAIWSLACANPEFTNALSYGTLFTNTFTVTAIPTGLYTVTFPTLAGFTLTTPNPQATNIVNSSPAANSLTAVYTRNYGTLQIAVSPSNASWTITNYPADFGGPLSGTGSLTISNAPAGAYSVRFEPLTGYVTPASASGAVIAGGITLLSGTYVHSGSPLIVHIGPRTTDQQLLPGIGAGSCTIEGGGFIYVQTAAQGTYYFPADTEVTITANPAPVGGLDSFVYKWYRRSGSAEGTPFAATFTLTMGASEEVWLLYSREYFEYDNVGDIDQDGLPDVWEMDRELNPEKSTGDDGASGNPDRDFIPSSTPFPATTVRRENNLWRIGEGEYAGYPLSRGRLLSQGLVVGRFGYADGVPFNNFLECRGLDGYFRTNVPAGGPVYTSPHGDDPLTNPKAFDTDDDGMCDGWEYYFWHWRSANARAAGVTNSANLAWVQISPSQQRYFSPHDASFDTDGDGYTDMDEYGQGTDPTHADTDGDGMDDYWELTAIHPSAVSNALDYLNWDDNPDGDYYATVAGRLVLTAGTIGTAFADPVCYVGTEAAPSGVWVDTDTTGGPDIFTLYRDVLLKADSPLANGTAGTAYPYTVYYGTQAGLGAYQPGYPVWVDVDGDGAYTEGADVAVFNPPIKHSEVYCMAPAVPFPGVSSFDPRTAWGPWPMTAGFADRHPNTQPYGHYQEYLGGDRVGRVSWDAGGRVTAVNDADDDVSAARSTNPNTSDTDGDVMEDGWELYVGLNPNNAADATGDPDADGLPNVEEWNNVYLVYSNSGITVGASDPGAIVAPAPNDPHPRDTDWDGLGDAQERSAGTCPTAFDTDGDRMPDGWEVYAGSDPLTADADSGDPGNPDPDGDGLLNFQEYMTGAVDEWQYCDARWGAYFMTRKIMPWDIPGEVVVNNRMFIPPDWLTCGSFMLHNNVLTDVDVLRQYFPATNMVTGRKYEEAYREYHTTKANDPDSDQDQMDDYWEVYHGLNPCKGTLDMMMPQPDGGLRWSFWSDVDYVDADSATDGFQFGVRPEMGGGVIGSLSQMVVLSLAVPDRMTLIAAMIGPFNFGLERMDPDGDGLPNLDEYSYSPDRPFYHTDPSPLWRTDPWDVNGFATLNYTWDYFPALGGPFNYEETEGFDTDNDGVGDYAELNAAAGQTGNNPLDERNPIRNRALCLNGVSDFVRTPHAWVTLSESYLTRFCVEAWVRPTAVAGRDQVVVEKAGLYADPMNPAATIVGANFRLGATNGYPYILYHGRGSLRAYIARSTVSRLAPNVWAHLAGVYDGATLTLYVNGEVSAALRTAELPVTGVNSVAPGGSTNTYYNASAHSIMVGARDETAGWPIFNGFFFVPVTIQARDRFAGCLDEVRIWNGARSQANVIANKNRRIPRGEMRGLPLTHYYTFDDVPDPTHRNAAGALDEPVAPAGLDLLDPALALHPPITWWMGHPQRSTVYTGARGFYNILVSAADHAGHLSRVPPLDDRIHVSTNGLPDGYNNFANPYGVPAVSGGIINQDLVLFRGARALATSSWLDSLNPSDPDSTDTDGDGLPDWWEQKYGLDPNDPSGDNGAWGDPDNDGLNNRGEYLAGTDPLNSDTRNTGIGDYDIPRGAYSPTYGELYDDGDGMSDLWEIENGLDPLKSDGHLDLDGDGWSNYAEYLAGTDPDNRNEYPMPVVFGVANYYGNRTGTLRLFGYNTNTMDGVPQVTKIGADDADVAEVVGQADGTFYFTGRLPIAPIDPTTVVTISAPVSNMFVTFTFTGPGVYTYSGAGTDYSADLNYTSGRFTLRWASAAVPVRGADVTVEYTYANRNSAIFSLAGFREGPFYLLALLDGNGNNTYDAGEPLGIMDDQPGNLSFASISGVRILLTDTKPGFGRFAWAASSSVTSHYPVIVNKISQAGAPTILRRDVRPPRTYVHEWDFMREGIEGLMAGTYQWWMKTQNNTFPINWPAVLQRPTLVYPRGGSLYYARNQFGWTMDPVCPLARIQVERRTAAGRTAVLDTYRRAPWTDADGASFAWMKDYASEWGNGVYYWRVAGWTPQGESAWSDWQSFTINLSSQSSRWISGDIHYFGKAPATRIVVEAFDNRGFGGQPLARAVLTPPATTGWIKASYTLRGLEQGACYVRAYLDLTPALAPGANRELDAWESFGFYRDPNNFYMPGLVNLVDVQFQEGVKVVIRDQDRDNDSLPDAWEMAYFGTLDQTGDMDFDGDGESNLQEYIKEGVNLNPAAWDSDGDGLSDTAEVAYRGRQAAAARKGGPYKPGVSLNPTAWDTDGDRYSDGAEVLRYGTDPLDPNSYPAYRPLCFNAWPSPADYDGDGRSDVVVYNAGEGRWHILTLFGQSYSPAFGMADAVPMVGDFDGDGRSEFAFYQPAGGRWTLRTAGGQQAVFNNFGDPSMWAVPADYTGDARADLAVYDSDGAAWFVYDVWSGQFAAIPFGNGAMIPVPGDYNGDGVADLAGYDPDTGQWLVSCYHKYYRTWTTFGGALGGPGWIPVPGDYDGDGRNDACVFEPATGRWRLQGHTGPLVQGAFGWAGCVPVPGDYDGDGRTDVAVYDPQTGYWAIACWSGIQYEGFFGEPGGLPVTTGR